MFGSQFPHKDEIHDIHMNQGSLPKFDNGIYEDGGIIFYFPDGDHWEAIFIAFASQRIPTDNNGLPLPQSQALVELVVPKKKKLSKTSAGF